jgi:hypothetical protein
LESELLTLHISNLQHEETGQGNSVLIRTTKVKIEEKVEIAKVETTVENSPVNVIIVEKPQETKVDLCEFPSIGKHFDGHVVSIVFESRVTVNNNYWRWVGFTRVG